MFSCMFTSCKDIWWSASVAC